MTAFAVHPELELLRVGGAAALQLHLQDVLGIEREVVPNRDAAPGSKRHVLADAVVLQEVTGELVGLDGGPKRRIADREACDLARGRHVPLEQSRRDGQHVRVVVEPERGIVGRQQRRRPDVEREQIANRVCVLSAVEAMNGRPAGIRGVVGGAVQRRFERRHEGGDRRWVRPRTSGRRHRAAPQLLDHFFPDRHSGAHVVGIDRFLRESEVAGTKPFAVTGHAVAVKEGAVGRRGGHRSGRSVGRSHRCRDGRLLPGRMQISAGRQSAHRDTDDCSPHLHQTVSSAVRGS